MAKVWLVIESEAGPGDVSKIGIAARCLTWPDADRALRNLRRTENQRTDDGPRRVYDIVELDTETGDVR